MIALKLYPGEFRELIGYLWVNTQDQQYVPLAYQQVGKLILLSYRDKWTNARLLPWKRRRTDKDFTLRLPPVVALALYQDMQGTELTDYQKLLRDKLDQAIVNYQLQ